jgi:hypothetical protein
MSIDERIDNWRRCFKDRPRNYKTGSLEGNYKEPPVTAEILEVLKGQVFEKVTVSRQTIDLNDAILVEQAVISLPLKNKLVLVCNEMYPYLLNGSHFRRTCKAIGISINNDAYDNYLKNAKLMLDDILK